MLHEPNNKAPDRWKWFRNSEKNKGDQNKSVLPFFHPPPTPPVSPPPPDGKQERVLSPSSFRAKPLVAAATVSLAQKRTWDTFFRLVVGETLFFWEERSCLASPRKKILTQMQQSNPPEIRSRPEWQFFNDWRFCGCLRKWEHRIIPCSQLEICYGKATDVGAIWPFFFRKCVVFRFNLPPTVERNEKSGVPFLSRIECEVLYV